jgi:Mg/Co/Ni transporter MgtE
VAIHDWTFLLGPAFCAGLGNGLLVGYLMYRSQLVPRRMVVAGLVGGALALVTATAVLFGACSRRRRSSGRRSSGSI